MIQDARPDLHLAGDLLVGRTGEVDEFVDGVAASAGGGQLLGLDQDRFAGQQRVASAVVEVEVAVHHQGDVGEGDSRCREGSLQRPSLGAVVGLGLGVGGTDAGVEEDQSVVAPHQVGEHGFNPRLRAAGLRCRSDEVAQIESTHRRVVAHPPILAPMGNGGWPFRNRGAGRSGTWGEDWTDDLTVRSQI